jgi:hypothetical protein
MTSNTEDQDTALVFFKRLILSIILLDFTMDHLMELVGPQNGVYRPEFLNIMLVRFTFSSSGVKWNPDVEMRSLIKLINLYVKVRIFASTSIYHQQVYLIVGPHCPPHSTAALQILPVLNLCEHDRAATDVPLGQGHGR